MKLLNPGPVTLTERVRKSLAREDMCHREQEFADMTLDVMARLSAVYAEARGVYVPVLMSGSGTCAVEAMLQSLVPKKGKVLVVSNGVYGERAATMLGAQGKAFDIVKSASWTTPVDMGEVEKRVQAGGYSHVFAVHHETTTGRLNDVAAIGKLCKQHGVPLLLDAVSSFGGEDLRFDAWNLEACAATANKCLHGVPGICFTMVRGSVFDERDSGASSVYLDLFRYRKEQANGWSPFTQAVQSMVALQEALRELEDAGGWEKRNAHYKALTAQVMGGLAEMGIQILLESPKAYSSILTSYEMPSKIAYASLHDHLKSKGFVIYAGQGQFQGSIFRIAVMGDLDRADIDRLLGEVRVLVQGRA
jgi:2-aminoethylphosphonate-pyruvate transaminase